MNLYFKIFIFHLILNYSFQIQLKVSIKKYDKKTKNINFPKIRNLFQESTPKLNELELLTMPICLGTSRLCYDFVIDTSSFLFWIDEKYYSPSNSTAFILGEKNIKFNYFSGSINGLISKDLISFKDNPEIQFFFPIIIAKTENITNEIFGILGLSKDIDYNFLQSYENTNKYMLNKEFFYKTIIKYTLIEELFYQKIINQKIFEYKPINSEKGILYFGETEYNLNKYKKCSRTNSTKKYTGLDLYFFKYLWSCQLFDFTNENNISIFGLLNMTMLDFNIQVTFDSAANVLLVSNEIYHYLIKDYIEKSNNKCIQYKDTDLFHCIKNFDIKSLPKYYIKLENFKITIYPEDIFLLINSDEEFDSYLFRIVPNHEGISWIIGNIVLKKYQIAYNYEDKSVYFFDENLSFSILSKFIFVIYLFTFFTFIFYISFKKKIETKKQIYSQEMTLL